MLLSRSAYFSSPLGDRVLFYAMTGQEVLGRLFSYEVELLSHDDSLDLSELLGQAAAVALERTDGTIREFTGFVTEFAQTGKHGNYARYHATLRPWVWFLGQNRESRIFQNKSVPEIAKEIFRERGFSDFEDRLQGHYQAWEYLVQYRESDLSFISRMLEQEGIYYFFQHEDGRHKLVLADSASAHEAAPGYEHVPYFPPAARERRQEEHVDSWILSRRIRQGLVTLRDFNFTYPMPFQGEKAAPLPEPGGTLELYDYPAEINAETDADAKTATSALAEIRLEEHQADYETVRGGGPVRGLGAGSVFTLTRFPRDDQNKQHLIVSGAYEFRVAEYESNVAEDKEPLFKFEFSAIDSKRPYRSPRITRKPTIEGPQTAIVVGDPDQEIWTDEYGRVKVQFHWDRRGQRDQDSSCWVRVSQAWAGKGWGSMHLPRIGQEVIVDFLEGDPDRPIITGRVYNKDNPVPYKLPDNQTQSGFKSHSTKGGSPDNFNEIRFEDKKGEEEFHMQAEKNMSTTVKKDRSASVGGSDSVSVSGDRSVSVNGNLSVSVKGNGSGPTQSSHTVTGKHSLDASDEITITAPNKITLTVGSTTLVMTPSSITLTASDSQIAIDPNIFLKSSGNATLMLDPNACLTASGSATLLLDSHVLAASAQSASLVLDANVAASASSGDVVISGMNVSATGQMKATIGIAGSSVECSPPGTTVAGAMVNVNGNSMVSVNGPMIKIG